MEKKDFKAMSILTLQHLLEKKLIILNLSGFLKFRKFDIQLNNYYDTNKEELRKYD